MVVQEELKKTIVEELSGASSEYSNGRYKNASILFSKAIFAMCDYAIVSRGLRPPSNHEERFRILERHLPVVYPLVDRLFKRYTDTYLSPSDRATCEAIMNAVKKLGKIENFGGEIEAAIGKIQAHS